MGISYVKRNLSHQDASVQVGEKLPPMPLIQLECVRCQKHEELLKSMVSVWVESSCNCQRHVCLCVCVCACVHVYVIHVGVCVFLQFHLYPGLFSCFTFSRRETKNCLFWYHLYLQYFEGKYEEIFNVCKTIWELDMQIWKRIFFFFYRWNGRFRFVLIWDQLQKSCGHLWDSSQRGVTRAYGA